MNQKILLVDDEPAVLEGYQRLLGRSFDLDTAPGPLVGLSRFEAGARYAVVVSDMRMPVMNGAQFLAKIRSISPETVRIMLTGQAEMETAVNAVNEGNIFRFLTKPCNKDLFSKTLSACLDQHRLITTEKDLLENTLRGSIEALTEVLSLVNPAAFSRSMRVRRYVQEIAHTLRVEKAWQLDVAALMSQMGCVTLDPDTMDAIYGNQPLDAAEQARFDKHPAVAAELLARIPRMQAIAWMIAHQNNPAADGKELGDAQLAADARRGASVLWAALIFDELISKGASRDEALSQILQRNRNLDQEILHALRALDLDRGRTEIKTCAIGELSAHMVLNQEVRTSSGLLIVAKGQEVTPALIAKLKNFQEKGAITGHVAVKVTVGAGLAAGAS